MDPIGPENLWDFTKAKHAYPSSETEFHDICGTKNPSYNIHDPRTWPKIGNHLLKTASHGNFLALHRGDIRALHAGAAYDSAFAFDHYSSIPMQDKDRLPVPTELKDKILPLDARFYNLPFNFDMNGRLKMQIDMSRQEMAAFVMWKVAVEGVKFPGLLVDIETYYEDVKRVEREGESGFTESDLNRILKGWKMKDPDKKGRKRNRGGEECAAKNRKRKSGFAGGEGRAAEKGKYSTEE